MSDVAPLKGMPLNSLFIQGTAVTDLTPLKDLPLKELWCDFQAPRDVKILRAIKSLETINDVPAKLFLQE